MEDLRDAEEATSGGSMAVLKALKVSRLIAPIGADQTVGVATPQFQLSSRCGRSESGGRNTHHRPRRAGWTGCSRPRDIATGVAFGSLFCKLVENAQTLTSRSSTPRHASPSSTRSPTQTPFCRSIPTQPMSTLRPRRKDLAHRRRNEVAARPAPRLQLVKRQDRVV